MKKKCFIILWILLMCMEGMGCQKVEENEPVTLTFVHGWGGTTKEHAVVQGIFEEFDAQNEEIILHSQPSSDSAIAVEKANDMLALDEMPNIVSTHGLSYLIDNARKREKLLNLMPYIEEDIELQESIHPSVLENWTNADGTLYTVPDVLEVSGYWYNAGYFKAAGIVDENGNAKVPETWDEFFEACGKLEAWNKESQTMEAVYTLENVQVMENLLFARLGGESPEGLRMVTESPNSFEQEVFRKVIKSFSDIYRYSKNTENLENARKHFADGKTAMYFNGAWESGIIQNSDFCVEIAYAAYPTNYGETISYVSPSSGYVFFDSPDERENEAAIKFLKYMLSDEIQTKLAMETGQAPANPKVDNAVVAEKNPVLGNALKSAHEASVQIKTIASVWDSRVIETISEFIEEACYDAEALEAMIQKLEMIK